MRMAKSVRDSKGEPVDDLCLPLAKGTQLVFTFPDAASTYIADEQVEMYFLKTEHILAAVKPAEDDRTYRTWP